MSYLNLSLDYFTHPKTMRLVGLLGRDSEVLPIRLWAYCGKHHCQDGKLAGYAAQEIESIVGWRGKNGEMVNAMIKVGFLEEINDGYIVIDFLQHNGHLKSFKDRARQAAVKRWGENATSNATSIATSNAKQQDKQCPNMTLLDLTNTNKNKDFCAEPEKSGTTPEFDAVKDQIILVFPTTGKVREWGLTESKLSEYRQTYDTLDVLAICKQARQWCVDNPQKRKTDRGMPAFLTRWLSSAVNRPKGGVQSASKNKSELNAVWTDEERTRAMQAAAPTVLSEM